MSAEAEKIKSQIYGLTPIAITGSTEQWENYWALIEAYAEKVKTDYHRKQVESITDDLKNEGDRLKKAYRNTSDSNGKISFGIGFSKCLQTLLNKIEK